MADKVVQISPKVYADPPTYLTAEQAAFWVEVVNAKPVDWFTDDNLPLLEEYCRVVVMCRLLAVQIETAIAGGETGEVKALLDMRDKESKRLASLATKLRLTNQSRYTPQAAATANKKGGGGKVWQFGQKTGA